jgi:hypothetical protein
MQAVLYLLALATNRHFSKVLPANQSDFSRGSHPPPSGPSASRGRPPAPNEASSLREGLLMLTFPPDLSAPICTKPRSTTADRELNIDLPTGPGPRIKTSPSWHVAFYCYFSDKSVFCESCPSPRTDAFQTQGLFSSRAGTNT